MRRVILLIYVIVIVTITSFGDDFVERLAYGLSMSRTEVQTCFNKTNIKVEDLYMMDQLVDDNVQTMEIDRAALKVGCLMACLCQKKEVMSGTHININKIIELTDSEMKGNTKQITIRNRVLNICNERVKSKSEECEVALHFTLCVIRETRHYKDLQ